MFLESTCWNIYVFEMDNKVLRSNFTQIKCLLEVASYHDSKSAHSRSSLSPQASKFRSWKSQALEFAWSLCPHLCQKQAESQRYRLRFDRAASSRQHI